MCVCHSKIWGPALSRHTFSALPNGSRLDCEKDKAPLSWIGGKMYNQHLGPPEKEECHRITRICQIRRFVVQRPVTRRAPSTAVISTAVVLKSRPVAVPSRKFQNP
ncbi:hypothetical protein B0H12DRAFT_1130755 [Mycena haematopus]|nr:hypothetical protein B0H12DRAFT_1173321 [Mycena haematopus]KAJ7243618.1 hypothetical protein B0H12DRAFT_1130755 [Mycena haematopus]